MRNDFIKIELNEKNELRADAAFELGGNLYDKVSIKIDTGCPRTSIPVRKLGVSAEVAAQLKRRDCEDSKISKSISFGVNDSRQKRMEDTKRFKLGDFYLLDSISFRHKLRDLKINGVALGDFDVAVSYDRTGNILIGMDILRILTIHMGETIDGKFILLAIPNGRENREYQEELSALFHVQSLSCSSGEALKKSID